MKTQKEVYNMLEKLHKECIKMNIKTQEDLNKLKKYEAQVEILIWILEE